MISIHAPGKGSDHTFRQKSKDAQAFQSTLPVKGATRSQSIFKTLLVISIHAPGKGSDVADRAEILEYFTFQSTLPVKGATFNGKPVNNSGADFNPRSR